MGGMNARHPSFSTTASSPACTLLDANANADLIKTVLNSYVDIGDILLGGHHKSTSGRMAREQTDKCLIAGAGGAGGPGPRPSGGLIMVGAAVKRRILLFWAAFRAEIPEEREAREGARALHVAPPSVQDR